MRQCTFDGDLCCLDDFNRLAVACSEDRLVAVSRGDRRCHSEFILTVQEFPFHVYCEVQVFPFVNLNCKVYLF